MGEIILIIGGYRTMREVTEVTVREFVKAFEEMTVNVESIDGYGVSVNMTKARISYDGDFDELTFTSGNHNYEGVASISYNVEDCIECITIDEEDGAYTIEFSQYIPDIKIRKAV